MLFWLLQLCRLPKRSLKFAFKVVLMPKMCFLPECNFFKFCTTAEHIREHSKRISVQLQFFIYLFARFFCQTVILHFCFPFFSFLLHMLTDCEFVFEFGSEWGNRIRKLNYCGIIDIGIITLPLLCPNRLNLMSATWDCFPFLFSISFFSFFQFQQNFNNSTVPTIFSPSPLCFQQLSL